MKLSQNSTVSFLIRLGGQRQCWALNPWPRPGLEGCGDGKQLVIIKGGLRRNATHWSSLLSSKPPNPPVYKWRDTCRASTTPFRRERVKGSYPLIFIWTTKRKFLSLNLGSDDLFYFFFLSFFFFFLSFFFFSSFFFAMIITFFLNLF